MSYSLGNKINSYSIGAKGSYSISSRLNSFSFSSRDSTYSFPGDGTFEVGPKKRGIGFSAVETSFVVG